MPDVWKCVTCSDEKALSGLHLEGKADVSSECKTCGRMRKFHRHMPTAPAVPDVSRPARRPQCDPGDDDGRSPTVAKRVLGAAFLVGTLFAAFWIWNAERSMTSAAQ